MVVGISPSIAIVEEATQGLLDWVLSIAQTNDTYFQKAQRLARRLGAHPRPDGLVEIGFWTPRLTGEVIQSERCIYLEVFTPLDSIDFQATEQTVTFRRDRLELVQQGEYFWGVVSGMQIGSRDQAGSFYWLRSIDPYHHLRIIRDPLAYSLPYGVFAPAEVYDMARVQRQRADLNYFRQTSVAQGDPPRVEAPTNILQIHVSTASPSGTLAGLAEVYRRISDKLAQGQSLTPAESNYVGYDAVQLLPLEPTIEYRLEESNYGHEFFSIALNEEEDEFLEVTLRKPTSQSWGYDVPLLGSSTTNPSLLDSLRPDEMVDFIATLHNFSQGPIHVIYDLVFGHADNQAEQLLTPLFLKGPNMYGQDVNHQSPMVRAILLEMQRRKINTGADGIRVDGGQDFRWFNPMSGRVEQDDVYLLAMSDVVQEIEGYQRLLFTIFEDGRPWPQEGWEETSTYRDLIAIKPDSYQWGPLIFAHNTPVLHNFWNQKWQRVCEVMFQGENWITGCANHDTVRRCNQVDSENQPINWNLGKTLPKVLQQAYDNPGIKLWVDGFSPGIPMDFINATMRSPWGFFRNTDDRYGVKVMSEEIGFLLWQIEPEMYENPQVFTRLKKLGFHNFEQLKSFTKALQAAMIQTEYDLEKVAQICQCCLGPDPDSCEMPTFKELNQPDKPEFFGNLDVPALKALAMAYMEDKHDICNVSLYTGKVDAAQASFNLKLREFRRAHPWLRQNLGGNDRFNRIHDENHTLFYGLRTQPEPDNGHTEDTMKQIAMVVHMGGDPVDVPLADWLQLDLSEWQVAIATPGLELGSNFNQLRSFMLQDSQGVLLERREQA